MEKVSLTKISTVPSIRRNFSWTLFGNLIYAFTQWVIISIITKLGDAEMLGQYALALAVTAPIFLFLQMNLRSVQATDQKDKFALRDYLGLRVLTVLVAWVIIFFLLLFSNYSFQVTMLVLFVGIAKSAESFSEVFYGNFQKLEQMKYISVSKIIRGIISCLAVWLCLYLTNNIVFSIMAFSLIWLSSLALVDIPLTINLLKRAYGIIKSKEYLPKINLSTSKNIVLIAIPLGIAGTIDSLNTNIPRYLISYYHGEESLGYFVAISYIIIIAHTVIVALCHSATPRLSKYFLDNILAFKKLLFNLTFIGILISAMAIIVSFTLGGSLLSILYNDTYKEYKGLLIIIMVAGCIWYLFGFLNTAIIASRNFKLQIPILLISMITTFISAYILVPSMQLEGAAYSLIIGYLVRLLISCYFVGKIISQKNKTEYNLN
ncbi:oligosaccharide flippase family protein [Pseudalkalibacillus sp. A8]|uniref:oligosaccharide flippase family protein n=1 Tax=Pseudalkalibacillus sp. A8 TaxID=3382641 RepID=UPI0038B6740D